MASIQTHTELGATYPVGTPAPAAATHVLTYQGYVSYYASAAAAWTARQDLHWTERQDGVLGQQAVVVDLTTGRNVWPEAE